MTENPFSTPIAMETHPAATSEASRNSLGEIARSTFLAWEKLRLLYIAILGFFTLVLCGSQLRDVDLLLMVIGGGVFANLCYFAGPVLETYVSWLGLKGLWFRWLLFSVGTLFTMVMAFVAVLDKIFPAQN